jgi:hypothetical protein
VTLPQAGGSHDRDDWDEIPHRLPGEGGHAVRVDWFFTTIPRHTVSVIAAGKKPIALLVVSPGHGRRHRPERHEHGSHRPGRRPASDILTASGAQGRLSA